MSGYLRNALAISLLISAFELSCVATASARGGAAAYIMNSPGYQRALQESRQRYRDAYYAQQPYTKPPGAYPRKKWQHRGRR